MNKDYEKLLIDAFNKWGYHTQMLIWVEEMSELIQKLVKKERKINPSFKNEIEEELADVTLCIDQMILLFPNYKKYREQKIARLKRLVYDIEVKK